MCVSVRFSRGLMTTYIIYVCLYGMFVGMYDIHACINLSLSY